MADSLVQEISLLPPLAGLVEGLDPALADGLYPPTAAPDLENARTANGRWQTRRGHELWKTLGGSGDVRLLADHYEAAGTRIRLAARGNSAAAILYDLKEGTDSGFNTTTGGTGLGGSTYRLFRGLTLNDAFYFTDRAGSLRKYQETPLSGNQVRSVALPARPSASPVVRPKTYDVLEPWNGNGGAAPYGWTVSDTAKFDIEDGSGTQTSPLGGPTILLNTKTNPQNSPITENVSAEALNSNTIAMMVRNGNLPSQIVFQFGINAATDYTSSMDLPVKESWLPLFVKVGLLASINYKRFMVTENAGAADLHLSMVVLPGRLQGSYRYIYTHYDPTLRRESEPSDVANSGSPVDLSVVGTTGQSATQAALQKSAAITFTSDSGSDSSTTQIRIYRNGGVPSLTVDANGRSVWYRVGTVSDVSTTVSGAPAANATSFSVASATGLAIGDWIVIAKGSTGANGEEFVRITNIVGTTLTIARGVNDNRGLLNAHTNGQAVQVAFVDNVPNEQVDTSTGIDLERDDPPAAARHIARSPDGRLWLFNYSGKPTGVAVSNRATPDQPADYEVFPDDVDPLTRQSLTQGWRFEVGGDVNDEEIVWGGFFHGEATVITRRRVYRIHAYSQQDWGPSAVEPVLDLGCIAGDTVVELDGVLYWVSEGPRVVRWDGSGLPETLSHQRVNERLKNAPSGTWREWFAAAHTQEEGRYYSLYYTPGILGVESGSPANRSDALWWFEAGMITGVAEGAPSSTWPDAARYALDMQFPGTNGGTRPTYRTNIFGSQPAVKVVAGNQGDIPYPNFVPLLTNQSCTFYWVLDYQIANQDIAILMLNFTTGGTKVISLYIAGTTFPVNPNQVGYEYDVGGGPVDVDLAASVDGRQLLTFVFDKSAGRATLYRNGAQVGTSTNVGSGGYDFGQTFIEFLSGNGGTQSLVGYCGATGAFATAHDAATRGEIESYLMTKYGIA